MDINTFIKILISSKLQKIGVAFAGFFGLFWLFIEPAGLFLPQWFNWGWTGYISLAIVSAICAIATNLPQTSVSRQLKAPDCVVEFKVGDIFAQPEHLVIGINDVFDTEPGEVIRKTSVQGQFLDNVYGGDCSKLDADLALVLEPLRDLRREDPDKRRGKSWRYPIGTTVTLGNEGRRYFLSAYGRMGNDLRVKSTVDHVWKALSSLWYEVRLRGHGKGVSIPIIGSDLARTNLSRMILAKLIVVSFVAATKESFVANRLTVIIHPKDLDAINLVDLENFLTSMSY